MSSALQPRVGDCHTEHGQNTSTMTEHSVTNSSLKHPSGFLFFSFTGSIQTAGNDGNMYSGMSL